MRSVMIATAVLGLAILAGCGNKADRPLVTFVPTRPLPLSQEAKVPGGYELYAAGTSSPVYTITMDQKARFGFRNKGGVIVAFAQRTNTSADKPVLEDVEIPLPGGDGVEYFWKMAAPAKN